MLTPFGQRTLMHIIKDFSWIRTRINISIKDCFMILLFAIILALIAPWIIDI